MLILALDTATRAGSVALVDEAGRVIAECAGDPARSHTERLPREILALLEQHGRTVEDVDLFAVATGPGSFTGLRTGIATLQGFALVQQRPMVGVSALEALAQIGSRDLPARARVAAWMDAHRREVFSALYEIGDAPPFASGHLIEVEGAVVGDPASTLNRWEQAGTVPAVCIGDGARLYAEVAARSGTRLLDMPALAAAIGRLARVRAASGGAGHPATIQPVYVRRPDAEVDRDKRRSASWTSGTSSN